MGVRDRIAVKDIYNGNYSAFDKDLENLSSETMIDATIPENIDTCIDTLLCTLATTYAASDIDDIDNRMFDFLYVYLPEFADL